MKRLLVILAIWATAGTMIGQLGQDSLLRSGRLAYQSGDYGTAIACYRHYLKLAQGARDDTAVADAYRLIGDAFRASGEMESALEELEMGLKIAEGVADSNMVGRIYNRIAAVRFEMNDAKGSEAAANEAITLAYKMQDEATISSSLNILGAVYRSNGRFQMALDTLAQSISIQKSMGDTTDIPNALNNMANTLIELGMYQEAIDTAKRSFAMAHQSKILVYEQYASHMLYKAYRLKGEFLPAFDWMEIYNGLTQELLNEAKGKEISQLRSEMGAAQGELEYERLKAENALQQQTIASQNAKVFAIGGIGSLILVLTLGLGLVARSQKRANAVLKAKNTQIERQTQEISGINKRLEHVAQDRKLQQDRVEEINRVKDKLFSIISHDLRSPMNSIQGLLSLMERSMIDQAEFAMMADTLKTRVDSTTMLLDNLLNWSRSQMEGFSPQLATIDLGEMALMECRLQDTTAKAKAIFINNRIPVGTLATGDKNMVELVLRNLLSNAMKFTEQEGQITLIAEMRSDQLHIGIMDTGIGITPAAIGKVLGKDYYNTPGTNKERGSGLGLRLCKEFLDHNNGSLWFNSNSDKGTTFWFSLPTV